ncbi:putative porin, partial [Pseudomonas aeruginosa]|nr:putative porin [Pseudomonas aeruginosa]
MLQPLLDDLRAQAAAEAIPGEVRVPYIPQVVRDQIRDEVKAEV